jgi:DNA-binding SARP family transcriptional activator
MSQIRLDLLGPPRAELDGESVRIGRRKALALLVYLVAERGNHSADVSASAHSRDALATLLWPDYDQATARAHLRRALASLSKALGGEWFAAERESLGLNPEAAIWLDLDASRQRLAAY